MRHHLFRILGLGAVAAIALSAEHRAEAQFAPFSAFYVPLTRGGSNVIDTEKATAGERDWRDIVGDNASPAAFIASDATNLYFRIRVNQAAQVTGVFRDNYGWGCVINTDADLNTFDFLAAVDGNGGTRMVRYFWNQTAAPNNLLNNAETERATFAIGTHARQVPASGSNFSGTPDFYVDWAIPWATIRTPGGGAPNVAANQALRFICGTTTDGTVANDISFDAASSDPDTALTLTNSWSDPFVCNNGGNPRCTSTFDTDGDGVPNTVETALGMNVNNPDTDGDGIPDGVETSPVGSGGGVFSGVNTDGSGLIDARDTDSDDDCTLDSVDGVANYRNVALPNADPDTACTAPATRFCDTTSGTCVGCNGNSGSAATFACSAAAPACNTSGALDGQCTQCTATLQTECSGTTPICDTTVGTCAGCDSDNGGVGARNCPTPALPACQTGGNCTQCKAGATALCINGTPICNTTSGTCVACDGNNGSGTTAACPTAGAPFCNPAGAGALAGRCTACGPGNTALCTGATPTCDLTTGTCTGCDGDNGSGSARPCGAALPACHTAPADPLLGTCTECKPGLTTRCIFPAFPACAADTGTCAACNGHNGSAATAVCPDPTKPACGPQGLPFAGRCNQCSSNNNTLCANPTPACDLSAGTCASCDGDRNSGSARPCQNVASPYCFGPGASVGTCGKCTTSADCVGVHTGPTCDVPTGACVDVDTDQDGLQDAIELLLGTDPNKKDSDDDGIDDKTEVTPPGGGAFAKVDTDGDGMIDAVDVDSDNDGILDKDEARLGDAGALLDTDNDGTPNYRDDDDDNDLIKTKDEILDTTASGVTDDVDKDGKKNWLDNDADGDGIVDGQEGRGDDDGDGIPNYLDDKKDVKLDAGKEGGTSSTSSSGSTSSTSSSGGTNNNDGGSTSGGPVPPGDGVVQGTGLLCSSSQNSASPIVLLVLGAIAVAGAARRRRKQDSGVGKHLD